LANILNRNSIPYLRNQGTDVQGFFLWLFAPFAGLIDWQGESGLADLFPAAAEWLNTLINFPAQQSAWLTHHWLKMAEHGLTR